MIELDNKQLVVRFPEVHPEAEARIEFQRTLRIPDDNQTYPLPPGLGRFPLHHVDDYRNEPSQWRERGGVFMPLWQAEAAWINFNGRYPMAIKIAAGKINAVTGEPWANDLQAYPQDYVVIPRQPWLDGFCVCQGLVRQFVAAPLGSGDTAEEQITGEAHHGGLQVAVYPMKADVYERWSRIQRIEPDALFDTLPAVYCLDPSLGFAPGGAMRQEIYEDPHGIDAWDTHVFSRCFVHLLNCTQYQGVTGNRPPTKPPRASDYSKAGLPWFDYYDADVNALGGSKILQELDPLANRRFKRGENLEHNEPIVIGKTIQLGPQRTVRDGGDW